MKCPKCSCNRFSAAITDGVQTITVDENGETINVEVDVYETDEYTCVECGSAVED